MPVLKPEYKKEMFRYRTIEIGITAAFGGLAYAIRALGLVIPLGGGLLWDARRVAVMIAATLAGPIPGVIAGGLSGLGSALPPQDVPTGALLGLILGVGYRFLRRPYYHVTMFVAYGIWFPFYCWWLQYVTGLMPMTVSIPIMAVITVTDVVVNFIVIEAARKSSGFVRRLLDGAVPK